MNGLTTSSQNTSARRRVTDVAQVVTATGIEAVCVAGNRVALRFATGDGIVIVHCPLPAFVDKARAPHDHHGRPFAAAGSQPPTPNPEPETAAAAAEGSNNRQGRVLPPSTRDKLRWAWQCGKGTNETARALRLSPGTVHNYFVKFRQADPAAASPGIRPPYMKPGGKLL